MASFDFHLKNSPERLRLLLLGCLALLGVLAAGLALPGQAQAQGEQPTEEYCLSCHNNPDLRLELPSGESVSVHVDPDALHDSVHGELGITCISCHTGIHTYPHPPVEFETYRELQMSYYQACQRCHEDLYQETLDSIHAEHLAAGDLNAPICVDCHGAHTVQDPDEPRALVSTTCGQCHTEIFEAYQNSIHGAALIEEDNPDVPVCTDCHGVHAIHDPRTELFRVESPELCAGCHADAELMGKYGIDPNVYDIYDLSWHGVDVSVYQARWPNLWHQSAVCTDCHGTHNILPAEHPQSTVSQENLLATCRQCHEGAGPRFVGAWTGHNRISAEKTPFVFYTQVFYDYFAYAILWISAIYVLLQILRQTIARVRRSL